MLKQVRELTKAGKPHQAEALLEQLFRDKPQSPAVLQSYIEFHITWSRKTPRAVVAADRLVELRPSNADALAIAAEAHLADAKRRKATLLIEKALEIAPENLKALRVGAAVALQNNEFDAALDRVERAEAIEPDDDATRLLRARILYSMGRMEETVAACEDLLTRMPYSMAVIGLYCTAQTMTADDPVFRRLREEILPHQEKTRDIKLRETLRLVGTVYNEIGDYDQAFRAYRRSKELRPLAYNAKANAAYVSALRAGVSRADFFGRGIENDRPVLIVGLPRSGSTLLEQVLAGHPEIGSVGESLALRQMHSDIGLHHHNGAQMVKAIKSMPADVARRFAERYLRETDRPGMARVVDKSLHNFELLGLLGVALPRARIINILRDPLDNCTSMYMQALNDSHVYTQSLESLGHAFVQYRRLMEHWKKVLPNPILDVHYEETVADLEGQARRVIDFLGLEWTDKCLDFRNAENQVRTISARQVRQPIYRSSMQRWKRYEAHLDPLKQSLAQFYPNGFDERAVQ